MALCRFDQRVLKALCFISSYRPQQHDRGRESKLSPVFKFVRQDTSEDREAATFKEAAIPAVLPVYIIEFWYRRG